MKCRHWGAEWGRECAAVLPDRGERIVFGVHRLGCEDRDCKAFRSKPPCQVRSDASLRLGRKDPAYLAYLAKGGPRT